MTPKELQATGPRLAMGHKQSTILVHLHLIKMAVLDGSKRYTHECHQSGWRCCPGRCSVERGGPSSQASCTRRRLQNLRKQVSRSSSPFHPQRGTGKRSSEVMEFSVLSPSELSRERSGSAALSTAPASQRMPQLLSSHSKLHSPWFLPSLTPPSSLSFCSLSLPLPLPQHCQFSSHLSLSLILAQNLRAPPTSHSQRSYHKLLLFYLIYLLFIFLSHFLHMSSAPFLKILFRE